MRHGEEHPVPIEAALAPDPDLRLVHAPMATYVGCDPEGCRNDGACCCDEHCGCQAPEEG